VRLSLVSILALGSLGTADAQAPIHVRLEYRVPDGCPSEQTFRDLVAGRLGHDPFVASASRTVVAEVTPGRGFRGRVALVSDGVERGERRFHDAEPSCAEVARAIAVAIVLTLDPLGEHRDVSDADALAADAPAADAPAAEERVGPPDRDVVEAAASPPVVRSFAPRPSSALEVVLGAGVVGSWGQAPGLTLGPSAEVGVVRGPLRILLGVSTDRMLGAATLDSGDEVELHDWTMSLGACVRASVVLGCVAVDGGRVLARARNLNTSFQRDLFAAARLGAGLELDLGSVVAFAPRFEVRVPFVQPHLVVGAERVWSMPRVSLRLHLAVNFRFGRRNGAVDTSTDR